MKAYSNTRYGTKRFYSADGSLINKLEGLTAAERSLTGTNLELAGDFVHPTPMTYDVLQTGHWHGRISTCTQFSATYATEAHRATALRLGLIPTSYASLGWEEGPLAAFTPDWTKSGSFTADVMASALHRLYAKISSNDGLNLAVDLAEGRKTLQMLRNARKSLSKIAEAFFQKRKPRSWADPKAEYAKEVGRKLSGTQLDPRSWQNTWLEYSYGWRPLWGTVWGLAEQLIRPSVTGRIKLAGRSKGEQTGSYVSSILPLVSGVDGNFPYPTINWRRHTRVQYQGVFNMDRRSAADTLTRFTTLNPALIAWELVPYSFVIDWFVNIGLYLQEAEQFLIQAQKFEYGAMSYVNKIEHWSDWQGFRWRYPWGYYVYDVIRAEAKASRTLKGREVLVSLPTPSLPRLNPNLGWRRLLSGAALLSQMTGVESPSLNDARVREAWSDTKKIRAKYKASSFRWMDYAHL